MWHVEFIDQILVCTFLGVHFLVSSPNFGVSSFWIKNLRVKFVDRVMAYRICRPIFGVSIFSTKLWLVQLIDKFWCVLFIEHILVYS